MSRRFPVLGSFLLLLAVGTTARAAEEFRGHIVDTPQVTRAAAGFFTLHVDQWGTDDEARAYLQTLRDEGQEALQKAFSHSREAGWIKIGTQLGYSISFARTFDTPEGRVVRAFTDRPIQFFELRNGLRSADYPLGIVEIRFDAKGKGSGTLIAAASAKFNESGQLELENWGTQPFKLVNIKAEPAKDKRKK
ncbi:MAG: hypothetical protein AB7G12_11980 [Thermoanaerobaculia bacterium]